MRKKILLIFFAIFFLGAIPSFGQKYEILGSSPGTTIACPAGHENMHSRVGTPGQDRFMAQRKATSTTPPTSEIQFIFRGDGARDPDFRKACRYAADIWERYLVSSVPIVIDIGFENLGRNTLARYLPAGCSAYDQDRADPAPRWSRRHLPEGSQNYFSDVLQIL